MACGGCERRKNKFWGLFGKEPTAAVIFSGGLDSLYAAWYLREQAYNVHLYTVDWQYVTKPSSGELEKAKLLAPKLGMPLYYLGKVIAPDDHTIMRVPTIASMLLMHRMLPSYDVYAWGGHPSTYNMDAKWTKLLTAMLQINHPKAKLLAPCDGLSRQQMLEQIDEDLLT